MGLGVLFKDDLAGAQLVRRIDIREEESDGDGLGPLEPELPGRGPDRLLVERREHDALGFEAFGYVDAPPPRGDGDRGRIGRVPDALFPPAAELDLVAVAHRRDETRHRAVHLDQDVVAGGGAVNDLAGAFEQAAGVETPSASARSAIPRMTPSDWSAGVEPVLVKVMEPSGRASTKSVKVPPTSMPMR